jgi:hypothetical protein
MPGHHSVTEGWTGPGRCDDCIEPLPRSDDGLHLEAGRRGLYEKVDYHTVKVLMLAEG